MKREFSAGGIVIKKDPFTGWQVLLINNTSMKAPGTSYWGFPKGHIEGKESSKEASLREVKEETNISAKILEKIGDSKYVFTDKKGEKIFKVVIIYLMEYLEGEIIVQEGELADALWIPLSEVAKKLSFSNDKALFKKVEEKLLAKGD